MNFNDIANKVTSVIDFLNVIEINEYSHLGIFWTYN